MNERIRELAVSAGMTKMNQRSDGLIKDNTWHDGVRASIWSIQQEFGLDRNFGVEE